MIGYAGNNEIGEPLGHDVLLQNYDLSRQFLFETATDFFNVPSRSRHERIGAAANTFLGAHVLLIGSFLQLPEDYSHIARSIAGMCHVEDSIRHNFFASLIGEESTEPAISRSAPEFGDMFVQTIDKALADSDPTELGDALRQVAEGANEMIADSYSADLGNLTNIALSTPKGRLLRLEARLRENAPKIAGEVAKVAIGTGIGLLVGSRLRKPGA